MICTPSSRTLGSSDAMLARIDPGRGVEYECRHQGRLARPRTGLPPHVPLVAVAEFRQFLQLLATIFDLLDRHHLADLPEVARSSPPTGYSRPGHRPGSVNAF